MESNINKQKVIVSMRYKSISVNGRRLTAVEGVVGVLKNTGGFHRELTFENMDKILAQLESKERGGVDGVVTMTTGYVPEIRFPECGGDTEELIVGFGCYEVADFKGVYEQLKELNKDPEQKPNPNVLEVEGNWLSVRDGSVWTCDEDATTFYDRVVVIEDLRKVIAEMEHTALLPTIAYTGKPAVIQKSSDGKVYFSVGCVYRNLEQVKEATDFFEAVQKRQQAAEANPVGK